MPKITEPVDRSIRVIDAARIAQPDVRPRALALLRASGFRGKVADSALAFLEVALSWYRARLSNPEQYPRLSEQRAELETLIKKAKPLLLACQRLSQASRLKILDAHKARNVVIPEADTHHMQTELRGLIRRAGLALHDLGDDSGGVRADDDYKRLLFQIAVLWYRRQRKGDGVTKSGDRYRGPLVMFARQVLELEGVTIRTTLGKRLHELRAVAAIRADEERQRERAYTDAMKNDN